MFQTDWVTVDQAPNTVLAQEWAAYLQDHGVPCFIEGASLADERAAALQIANMLGVEIKTSRDRLEEARSLLSTLKVRKVGRPAVACPSCSETIESAFDACWKCGAARPDAAASESGGS